MITIMNVKGVCLLGMDYLCDEEMLIKIVGGVEKRAYTYSCN